MATVTQNIYEAESNDKDLTVLLLLKDRALFTWRWMSYANRSHFPFKILIADGGADKSVEKILSNKSYFPNVDYEYMRYPYDESYSRYYAKIADALSHVSTPMVTLATNDDFYFTDGLRHAVKYLRGHPDYVACGGDMHCVIVESCKRYGASPFYGTLRFTGQVIPAQDLADNSAIGRLRSYLYGITDTFLWPAVHRTEKLRSSYQALLKVLPMDIQFCEHFIFCTTIATGKIYREPGAYLLHQDNSEDSFGARIARETPTWIHWIRRKGWLKDFSSMVKAVGRVAAEYDGVSAEDACEDFSHFYLSLIGKGVVRIFHPSFYEYRQTADMTETLRHGQFHEIETIKEFLAGGPSILEKKIWKEKRKGFYYFVSPLKRMKKRLFRKNENTVN